MDQKQTPPASHISRASLVRSNVAMAAVTAAAEEISIQVHEDTEITEQGEHDYSNSFY